MAFGRLGQAKPAANADGLLYTGEAGKKATITVNCANDSAYSTTVRIYLTTGGAPTSDDVILPDDLVAARKPAQFTGIPVGAGQKIYVRSGTGSVNFTALGSEGSA